MEIPKMDKSPNHSRKFILNRWADYVELLCLTNLDNEISTSDIAMLFGPDDLPTIREEYSIDYNHENVSESNDKWETFFVDVFEYLAFRQKHLAETYPFELIDNDTIALKTGSTDYQRIYLFLLFASNTRYFDNTSSQELTTAFEQLSHHIFSLMYPRFTTEIFGTSAQGKGTFSGGTLKARLQALAACLNTKLRSAAQSNPHNLGSSGDSGLDLVAYLSVDKEEHGAPFVPICFGQCSCSYDDWSLKQSSIGYQEWQRKLECLAPIHEYMFVPFSLRGLDGDWAQDEAQSIIINVIDRFRFLDILIMYDNDASFFLQNPIYDSFVGVLNSLNVV